MREYYGSLLARSWDLLWAAADWTGRALVILGVAGFAVGLFIDLLLPREDIPMIPGDTLTVVSAVFLIALFGFALLRANYERYTALEATGAATVQKLRAELAASEAASQQRIADLQQQVDDLRERIRPKLSLRTGKGGHFEETDYTRGDRVVMYRIAIDNESAFPIAGVQVRIAGCTHERTFVKNAPVRVRDKDPDGIVRQGVTVHPGVPEYAELLEIHYGDRNRVLGIYPASTLSSVGHRITSGDHLVTLAVVADGMASRSQVFRITVSENPPDLVSIVSEPDS